MKGKKRTAVPNGHGAAHQRLVLNLLEAFEDGQEIIGGISMGIKGGELPQGYSLRLHPCNWCEDGLNWSLELWEGLNSTFVDRDHLIAQHEYSEDFLRSLINGDLPRYKHLRGGAALAVWMTREGLELLTAKPAKRHGSLALGKTRR